MSVNLPVRVNRRCRLRVRPGVGRLSFAAGALTSSVTQACGRAAAAVRILEDKIKAAGEDLRRDHGHLFRFCEKP
jgi:hypothetical protein